MHAPALAASLRSFETPEAVYRHRLELAASVAGGFPDVVAALVVGSTALRRCSPRADLDIVLVTASSPGADRFSSLTVDGVRVEAERTGRRRALACTEGEGWVWELREAARLGCGVAVFDPTGFAAVLAERAAAMTPRRARVEATLRDVYLSLVALDADRLRGCLDNLGLLALLERPRRYQKPKWVLADLLHAGEVALVDAILAAYDGPPALAGAGEIIARTYEIAGLPTHEEVLAMGHAPSTRRRATCRGASTTPRTSRPQAAPWRPATSPCSRPGWPPACSGGTSGVVGTFSDAAATSLRSATWRCSRRCRRPGWRRRRSPPPTPAGSGWSSRHDDHVPD